MTVSWMLTVYSFDLLLERLIFQRLLQLPVDILAIDAQGFSTHGLDPGMTDYFDFFCRCISSVNSPIRARYVIATGMLLLKAYEAISDKRYLQRALELAQYMRTLPHHANGATFHRPNHPDYYAFLYVDCMGVDAPFLCRLASVTGDARWYDTALEQITGYAALLQDEQSGLFFHQYDGETGRSNGAFWGRGNGWALLGLTKTLDNLPSDHAGYTEILGRYRRLCDALASCQASNGGWHTVLDDSKSYLESSLPSMFGLGLLQGVQRGWLDGSFERTIEAAWQATYIALDNGLLKGTSIATPPGSAQHYNRIPVGTGYPWGQGPALAFAVCKLHVS